MQQTVHGTCNHLNRACGIANAAPALQVRRVLDQIRGRSYEEAIMMLEYMPYKVCGWQWPGGCGGWAGDSGSGQWAGSRGCQWVSSRDASGWAAECAVRGCSAAPMRWTSWGFRCQPGSSAG